MFRLYADTEWKCCVCLMETSKGWQASPVMWITIGSSSKCLNRSDIDEKAMPLLSNNCFSWERVGGSADLRSFLFQKCLIWSENTSHNLPLLSCTYAFSTLLEQQLHLKQTFPQIGSNKVKASPKNTFGLVLLLPWWVNFPGRSTWLKKKKKKKCVNMSERAHFPMWKSNTNTCAAACWGSSRDPLKRSPQVIEKEQKE